MVLFVVGMTALTSCTKNKEKQILGKWKLEKVSVTLGGYTIQMTTAQLAEMLGEYGEGFEDVDEVVIEFKKDGNVYYQEESAKYVIDGEKLTLSDSNGESLEATIIELTKTEMTLEGKEVEVDEETGITTEMIFNLYFKKV